MEDTRTETKILSSLIMTMKDDEYVKSDCEELWGEKEERGVGKDMRIRFHEIATKIQKRCN